MSDPRIERAYAAQLARQAKAEALNKAKGRSLENIIAGGTPFSDVTDVVKKAEGYNPGIKANVGLSKFNDIAEEIAPKAEGIFHNTKGFAKLLPLLGMGGAALAASSIFNKAKAGDLPAAAAETADVATDYVPGLSNIKMALNPTEMGNSELPADIMEERSKFNSAKPHYNSPAKYSQELKSKIDDLNSQLADHENSTLRNAIDPYSTMKKRRLEEELANTKKSYEVNSNPENFKTAAKEYFDRNTDRDPETDEFFSKSVGDNKFAKIKALLGK